MNAAQDFLAAREFLLAQDQQPERAYRDFRWPELPEFNWALDHFDHLAAGNDAIALWIVNENGEERQWSFEQLRQASNRAANFLRGLGVRRGDRVLLMLPNTVELWEITLGAMKLGAVLSPATTLLSQADLADRISRGAMSVVVAQADCTQRFAGIAGHCTRIVVGAATEGWLDYACSAQASAVFSADAPTRAGDALFLYFTSGTTSKPKIVMHTHRSYPIGHLSTLYWLGLRRFDIHLNISSPGWAKHAWSCLFAPWTVGATIFIYNQGRFDAARTLATLVRCGVTSLCAPPTAWRSFILEDLSTYPVKLRELASAGEPLNPEVIEQVQAAWGLQIREGYGQTESTAMLGNPPGQALRHGSMGRPLPGYHIELIDGEGRPAAEGELSVALDAARSGRPAGIMAGYFDEPERTARALGGPYYGTGDYARRDADGYYWFVGRIDDVFKSSDYRISPFELESALLEHEAIAEAAVIESPDPKRLCVPKACVVLKPGLTASRQLALEILRFARQRLAPYQRIRILEFRELPKTVSGKIRRAELRAEEARHRASLARAAQEFFDSDFTELNAGGQR
ncbi:acetyl-CoA synthetase [Solimonas aquatica]|uniref:Acetyl-CoA synthetase n=1 Tax=Solimonas aquatica TaxID=489703 RepID=A0A1H9BF09_9GAMM|nr:AMP-binding protein [Solimonas aquatica]SEP87586.1 acetyl-CoA synthetase [Solimonas aquatica]